MGRDTRVTHPWAPSEARTAEAQASDTVRKRRGSEPPLLVRGSRAPREAARLERPGVRAGRRGRGASTGLSGPRSPAARLARFCRGPTPPAFNTRFGEGPGLGRSGTQTWGASAGGHTCGDVSGAHLPRRKAGGWGRGAPAAGHKAAVRGR